MSRAAVIIWWLQVALHYLWLIALQVPIPVLAAAWLAREYGWPVALAVVLPLSLILLLLMLRALSRPAMQSVVEIARPPAAVFDFVARDYLLNRPHWFVAEGGRELLQLEQTSAGPMDAGKTWREVVQEAGQASEWRFQVIEYVPERRMVLTASTVAEGWRMRSWYEFVPAGNGTRLLLNAVFVMPLRWGFLSPIYAPTWRADFRKGAENIRAVVEREISIPASMA